MGKPEHEAFSGGKDGAQPPVVAVHPTDAARTPREVQVREPGHEWTMTVRPPTRVAEMRDTFPRRELNGVEVPTYLLLGREPLHVISAQQSGEEKAETIVVGPALTALEISSLFYYAAPDKSRLYKLDTPDTINDWGVFDEDTEYATRLRTAHETMPGFTDFQTQRQQILGVLKRNYRPLSNHYDATGRNFVGEDPTDVLIPVLRLKEDDTGTMQIVLQGLDDEMRTAIAKALPEEFADPDRIARMNTGMGIAYAAAFSPENTDWYTTDAYVKKKEGEDDMQSGKPKQSIGPTQALGYAYREIASKQQGSQDVPVHHDLQASPLIKNLVAYAATGEVYRTVTADELALPDYPVQDLGDLKPQGGTSDKIMPLDGTAVDELEEWEAMAPGIYPTLYDAADKVAETMTNEGSNDVLPFGSSGSGKTTMVPGGYDVIAAALVGMQTESGTSPTIPTIQDMVTNILDSGEGYEGEAGNLEAYLEQQASILPENTSEEITIYEEPTTISSQEKVTVMLDHLKGLSKKQVTSMLLFDAKSNNAITTSKKDAAALLQEVLGKKTQEKK